jgi:hypothetical protein
MYLNLTTIYNYYRYLFSPGIKYSDKRSNAEDADLR